MAIVHPRPHYRLERKALKEGFGAIAGVDEAGCAPLAGPVVAAAVMLDPKRTPRGINDSKKLSPEAREDLYGAITAKAQWAVGIADVARIDTDNILNARLWAMARAVEALSLPPDLVLVDGNRAPGVACRCRTVVGGDGISLSIAAASIIAKVTRDRLMRALDSECPGYGFASHKGYGTPDHQAALARLGPSPHHRRSFAPVRLLLDVTPKIDAALPGE
jgi:ribonuclease HII